MRRDRISWLLASGFSSLMLVWLYINSYREFNYKRDYPNLYNHTTQSWNYPRETINATRHMLQSRDWIQSTNAQQRVYEEGKFWNILALVWLPQKYREKEDLLVSGGHYANQTKCTEDINWIIEQINATSDYTTIRSPLYHELTKYLDSFGRPEPSFYWAGALNWLGSHNLCLKSKLSERSIETRYCLGYFRLPDWPVDEIYMPKTKIKLGICLPNSCDTQSFNLNKREIEFLSKYELPEQYRESLIFDSFYCLPDETSSIRKIPTSGWVLMAIMSSWVLFVLYGSYKTSNSRTRTLYERLLQSISVQKSLSNLQNNRRSSSHSNIVLGPWDFIKIMMTLLIMFGHSQSVTHFYLRTYAGRRLHLDNWITRICLSFGNFMNTFYILFGLFTSLNLLKSIQLDQLVNPWTSIKLSASLVVHIVPIYSLVHWFNHSIMPYLGYGPNWDYGVDLSSRRSCMQTRWWQSIPYLATSATQPTPPCNTPGWFIISYLQLAPLIPIMTYILTRLSNCWKRLLFVFFLLLVSNANSLMRFLSQKVINADGISLFGGFMVLVVDKFEPSGYQDTLGRLGPVAFGCLLGLILHKHSTWNCIPRFLTSNLARFIIPIAHLLIICLPVIAKTTYNDVSLLEMAIIFSLIGMVWVILNSLLVIQIATAKPNNVLIRFSSHHFWTCLNKLTLSIYLIHLEIINYINQAHENAPSTYGHQLDIVKNFCFTLWTALMGSIFVYIFIESPIDEIKKLSFGKQKIEAKQL